MLAGSSIVYVLPGVAICYDDIVRIVYFLPLSLFACLFAVCLCLLGCLLVCVLVCWHIFMSPSFRPQNMNPHNSEDKESHHGTPASIMKGQGARVFQRMNGS